MINQESKKPVDWGIGLRPQHFAALGDSAAVPLLEIMSDNLMFQAGGPALARTLALAEHSRMLLHGVALDIGGSEPLAMDYVDELQRLVDIFQPCVVSDHLCFTRAGGHSAYELLPIPRSRRYLQHIAERVSRVQDRLRRQICLENPSAYIAYRDDEMSEGEFFSELARQSGCGLLLDLNNLHVNAFNFGFDAKSELLRFPIAAVKQIHIAGYTDCGSYFFDTHDQSPSVAVLELLKLLLQCSGDSAMPIILEWDDRDASLALVLEELQKVQKALKC